MNKRKKPLFFQLLFSTMNNAITSNQMCILVFKRYSNTILKIQFNMVKDVKILFITKGPVQSALTQTVNEGIVK